MLINSQLFNLQGHCSQEREGVEQMKRARRPAITIIVRGFRGKELMKRKYVLYRRTRS